MGGNHVSQKPPHRFKAIYGHSEGITAQPDNSMKASLSKASEPASSLEDSIAKGITNGITEAQAAGYFADWMEADKVRLIEIIRDNVLDETARSRQNSVPLTLYCELQRSYQELQTRFNATLPATAIHNYPHSAKDDAGSKAALINGTRVTENGLYSAFIKIEIVHQMSVNRMEGRAWNSLREAISSAVKAFSSSDDFSGSVRLSAARLLDSGDVEVIAHAEYREDLDRLAQTKAWHQDFERSLGSLPVQSYNVRMYNMRIGCMVFENRKQKSAAIRTLIDTNFPTNSHNSHDDIIRDILWCGDQSEEKKKQKATAALVVEFCSPEYANKALANGLFWLEERHACNFVDPRRYGLQRCTNCQGYNHLSVTCSAPPVCGQCTGEHPTGDCTSEELKCAICGGAHLSAGRGCLLHRQNKQNHRFPTTHSP